MAHRQAERAAQQAQQLSQQIASQAPSLTTFNPFAVTTPIGSVDIQDQQIQADLSPLFQNIVGGLGSVGVGGLFGGAGLVNQAANRLNRIIPDNIWDMAGEQFRRMESIVEPVRERQRRAFESRLLAQGRLGSTGGELSRQALEEAFAQQQRMNLAGAFREALAQQAQNAQINTAVASQLASLGLGQQNLARGLFGDILNINQSLFTPIQLAGMFGNLQSVAGQRALAGMGMGLEGLLSAGKLFSVVDQLQAKKPSLGKGLFALGGSILGGMAGPLGEAIGGRAGDVLGDKIFGPGD